MENIIDKLYEAHIETETVPFGRPNKEELDEEWALYQFLYENLASEQRQAFSRYAELITNRQERERKAVYEYGFKTGIQIIIQSLKE